MLRSSRLAVLQNMMRRRLEIYWAGQPDGIGGEFACPVSANRIWRSESRGAAQPVHGFPQADVDVSPPRDPGVMNRGRKESGNE